MKRVIQWAIGNSPAMNVLMIASLIVGVCCLIVMRREVFPNFDLEIILISVPYPGASPDEVEEGICQIIEERMQTVDGIKKITSVAREGTGFVILELKSEVKNVPKVMADVKSEIDQIPATSLPEFAEDPDIQQISFPQTAITIGVVGPELAGEPDVDYERDLRLVAEEVRAELLQLPPPEPKGGILLKVLGGVRSGDSRKAVSSAEIKSAKQYEIDIEVSEDNLRSYDLTLPQIAQIIRQENLESPGGKLKSAGQEILVRGKNKQIVGPDIERIKIKAQPNGDILTVGDIAEVKDAFEDRVSLHRIDGRPGLVIEVKRTTTEDLFAVVDAVNAYVNEKQAALPQGYGLKVWGDMSTDVRDRLDLLTKNGLQGLILVFLVLAVFLELRLAFWVALGIPVSVLGAGYVLLGAGQTLNMLSMFAFLMTLGIVVDDAIVIGENVYQHRNMGKSFMWAAVDGTVEVLPSVASSVATTIIAFIPLLFVSGVMGKFIAVMPLAVISMLIISLIESTFVLPCHLAHEHNLFIRFLELALYPLRWVGTIFAAINRVATWGLETFVEKVYIPLLTLGLNYRMVVVSMALGILVMAIGFVVAGITPFEFFPKLDNRSIHAIVEFPDGTSTYYAKAATQRIEEELMKLNAAHEERYGKPLVETVYLSIGEIQTMAMGPGASTQGGHVASVQAELIPVSDREQTSDEILQDWRERVGEIAGAQTLKFGTPDFGPGGKPIEFKILADKKYIPELERSVEDCRRQLASYTGVTDIEDDSRPGKAELQTKIKEDARSLGVTQDELNRTLRATYYGEEVMHLQRGRHDVKLMVRYPKDERQSVKNFEQIRVRGRPITELADITVAQGYSEINRVDQLRSITVSADVDKSKGGNSAKIAADLKKTFIPELQEKYPHISIKWEGQQQQSAESFQSLAIGFGVAMIAMFVLLTVEFRSYMQPIIIMSIIPFGGIGAILGHAVMGLELTLFSVFGLVALSGVIVNDSIVLVDFINHRLAEGMPLKQALIEAARRRFRPVLLTSLTTVAGLVPILLETSFQAQVLIPMAASLCFGLITATTLILILVPVFYDLLQSATRYFHAYTGTPLRPSDTTDPSDQSKPESEPSPHPYAVS